MCVLALAPEADKSAVPLLQSVCQSAQVPLFGAVFPQIVCKEEFCSEGLLLLCLDRVPAHFMLEDLQQDDGGPRLAQALADVMSATPPERAAHSTLFTIFDGMLPHIGSLLDTMHLHQSRVPRYLGVNAGSETFTPMPCLFDGQKTIQNGVLALLLEDMPRAVVHHAYEESHKLWRATSSAGNRIVSIEGQPAFEVYQKIVHEEYGVDLTAENFYQYAVHFPFGLVTAVDILVRIPVGLEKDGSLVCVGEIPPDSMLRLLRAPTLEASTCVSDLVDSLQEVEGYRVGQPLLTFYCAGRRMHFGAAAGAELRQLGFASESRELFGALTLGEIDTFEGISYPRFHNAAVVCIAQG